MKYLNFNYELQFVTGVTLSEVRVSNVKKKNPQKTEKIRFNGVKTFKRGFKDPRS